MNRDIIKRIVRASGIRKGELVLVQYWGEDTSSEYLTNFVAELAGIGATPFILQQSRVRNTIMFEQATTDCFDDKYFSMIEKADCAIDLIEGIVSIIERPLEADKMDICRKYMQRLFQTLAARRKFLQVRIPNECNAASSGLEVDEYKERMALAYDIDYYKLYEECREKVEEMNVYSSILIRTGAKKEYEVSLSYENREWHIDAGDGDLPCGEIYIAPLEELSNGSVYFERIYYSPDGNPRAKELITEVVLTIEGGKVSNTNNEQFNQFLRSLSDEDKIVCELGFGMNHNVTSLCGYTLLDEKMGGTFHLAMGDNSMFGGKNEANIHLDMVGNGEIEHIRSIENER